MSTPVRDLQERFWENVDKSEGCWDWTGYKSHGYGRITVGPRRNQKTWSAHRLSWTLAFGEIPLGMVVCHRCDNPSCVRPDHLFIGTQQDNIRDMVAKGRHAIGPRRAYARGANVYGAKLSDDEVREVRQLASLGWKKGRIAELFCISETQVYNIIGRRTWSHVA